MTPIAVEFTKHHGNFCPGHRVIVSDDQAQRLLALGVAKPHVLAPMSDAAKLAARQEPPKTVKKGASRVHPTL